MTIQITRLGNVEKAIGSIEYSEIRDIENAEPTSRVLDGSYDHGFAEEWSAPAKLFGTDAVGTVIYLFTESDITDDDGEPLDAEFYPWDEEHTARVIVD